VSSNREVVVLPGTLLRRGGLKGTRPDEVYELSDDEEFDLPHFGKINESKGDNKTRKKTVAPSSAGPKIS
jgi:hypothetical protein